MFLAHPDYIVIFFVEPSKGGPKKKKDNSQAIVGEVRDGLKRQSMG